METFGFRDNIIVNVAKEKSMINPFSTLRSWSLILWIKLKIIISDFGLNLLDAWDISGLQVD